MQYLLIVNEFHANLFESTHFSDAHSLCDVSHLTVTTVALVGKFAHDGSPILKGVLFGSL